MQHKSIQRRDAYWIIHVFCRCLCFTASDDITAIYSEIMMYVLLVFLTFWLLVEMVYCYRKISKSDEQTQDTTWVSHTDAQAGTITDKREARDNWRLLFKTLQKQTCWIESISSAKQYVNVFPVYASFSRQYLILIKKIWNMLAKEI